MGEGLFDSWNHLSADGAVRIFPVDQIEKVRSDSKGKLGVGKSSALTFLRAEIQTVSFQIREFLQAMPELPFPVLPVARVDRFPGALRCMRKCFQWMSLDQSVGR